MHSTDSKPFVVGVTGGIGCGKSAVTDFFADLGITIVDADIAARAVVEPGQPALEKIAARYGGEILLQNGTLDRRKLRDIIFNNPAEKQWLETLLHPKIGQLIQQQLTAAPSAYAILVSPLLIETSQHQLVDRILVVDVPEQIQLERTMARDNMTEEQTRRIIKSQASREQRLAVANEIVDNSGTLKELQALLSDVHQQYLQIALEK